VSRHRSWKPGTALSQLALLPSLLLLALPACAVRATAHVDYIDCIRFSGITYIHRPALPPQSIGQRYASVKAHLQDTQNDPNYQPRDGDSAFPAPGHADLHRGGLPGKLPAGGAHPCRCHRTNHIYLL
jgi:hypothetical protein